MSFNSTRKKEQLPLGAPSSLKSTTRTYFNIIQWKIPTTTFETGYVQLTSIAFSSMPLGYSIRPPYWKVFLRFCSQALAIPSDMKTYIKHFMTINLEFLAQNAVTHTLIVNPLACTDILKVFKQVWFEHFGTFVVCSEDVKQPPTLLTAFPVKQSQTHLWPCARHTETGSDGVSSLVRFGAGVSSNLLEDLAVSFISH